MAASIPQNPLAARSVRRSLIAIVLAFAAGATDAFAFLLLGGVFTANMTGNLVLAGLTERPGYPTMIVAVIVAIVVFTATVYLAFRVLRPGSPPVRQVALLGAAWLAQLLVLLGWVLAPSRTAVLVIAVLVGFSSVAMAMQTAVARHVEVRSGVSTTFVTGTLTSVMSDLADRKPQALLTRLGSIAALVAGAFAGSLLIGVAPVLGAALPVLPAFAGTVLLATAPFSRRDNPEDRRAGATPDPSEKRNP